MQPVATVPVRACSRGGVADRPQLALFGEGDKPEAFVPLPDGRTIPVTLDLGGWVAELARALTPPERPVPVDVRVDSRVTATVRAVADAQGAEAAPPRRDGVQPVAPPRVPWFDDRAGPASTAPPRPLDSVGVGPSAPWLDNRGGPSGYAPAPDTNRTRAIGLPSDAGGGAPVTISNTVNVSVERGANPQADQGVAENIAGEVRRELDGMMSAWAQRQRRPGGMLYGAFRQGL